MTTKKVEKAIVTLIGHDWTISNVRYEELGDAAIGGITAPEWAVHALHAADRPSTEHKDRRPTFLIVPKVNRIDYRFSDWVFSFPDTDRFAVIATDGYQMTVMREYLDCLTEQEGAPVIRPCGLATALKHACCHVRFLSREAKALAALDARLVITPSKIYARSHKTDKIMERNAIFEAFEGSQLFKFDSVLKAALRFVGLPSTPIDDAIVVNPKVLGKTLKEYERMKRDHHNIGVTLDFPRLFDEEGDVRSIRIRAIVSVERQSLYSVTAIAGYQDAPIKLRDREPDATFTIPEINYDAQLVGEIVKRD